jgi:hypothetical protein
MSTEQKPVGANQWMVSDAGQQQGPFALDELKQMIRDGRLSPAALVWTPGMTEWKSWNQVPELGGTDHATPRTAPDLPPARFSPTSLPDRATLMEYLVFRKMITPLIIQIIFWLGIAAVAIVCLIQLISAMATGSGLIIVAGLFGALIFFVLGAVTVRIYCELLIVAFRILDTLGEIKSQLEKK